MKKCKIGLGAIASALAFGTVLMPTSVKADGTEALGLPSVDVATGAGFVAAGTGTVDQPGVMEFDVPADESIAQVLLYWSGEYREADDDTISVNGVEVTGTLIGGPTFFYSFEGQVNSSAYRADITDLELVTDGSNYLEVTDMDFDADNAGAGVIVIFGECGGDDDNHDSKRCRRHGRRTYRCNRHCKHDRDKKNDDDDCASIQVLDGLDIAFFQFPEPRRTTVPQMFTFDASSDDRVADLAIFTGSVEADRPNQILITVDGETTEIIDLLGDSAGPSWDAPTIPVDIPAGATSVTVEIVSTQSTDPLGASVVWVTAALAVPDGPADDGKPHWGKKNCRRTRHHNSHWSGKSRSGRGWCRKGGRR